MSLKIFAGYRVGTGYSYSGTVRVGYNVVGSGSGPGIEKENRFGSGCKNVYLCRTLVKTELIHLFEMNYLNSTLNAPINQ